MSEHTSPRLWLFVATALLAALFERWAEAGLIAMLGACDFALALAVPPAAITPPRRELELLDRRMALPAAVALGVLSALGLLRVELVDTLLTVAALAVACWPGGPSWLARRELGSAELERGLRFLPVCGLGTVFAALLGTLAGTPPPLLPLQLLWLALLARALLVALARVPATARRDRAPHSGVAGSHWVRDTVWAALVVASLALLLGRLAWQSARPSWRSVVFTTFAFALVALALTAARPALRRGARHGLGPLAGVAGLAGVAHVGLLYWPAAGALFGLVPLTLRELGLCAAISLAVPLTIGPELRSFHPPFARSYPS